MAGSIVIEYLCVLQESVDHDRQTWRAQRIAGDGKRMEPIVVKLYTKESDCCMQSKVASYKELLPMHESGSVASSWTSASTEISFWRCTAWASRTVTCDSRISGMNWRPFSWACEEVLEALDQFLWYVTRNPRCCAYMLP